ncbi:MAG: hypothetical protein PWQ59_1105 [Thermoanaerobacterium sp.]|uniref:dimethylarginine dimethylaminohydrolase family protein n=1 Tax=Thermoanaerobacterium thermosaccharolyticum TaxID=1517 RepID=UPI0024AB5AC5|nr:hypothetical protein [Thermoanaerobacterium sp.]MDK2806812.1 hypothetical protein [Thermoanaerobacterium sp.]MDN5317051.1 hypothetical protein [Thermoanaerobacterium sp.]
MITSVFTPNNSGEFLAKGIIDGEGIVPWLSIKEIRQPSFLMSPPFGLSGEVANNVWMENMKKEDRVVNLSKAMYEFHNFFNLLSEYALVFLLPPYPGLQDLVYVANMGIVPPHMPDVAIISNFRSIPRRGEDILGLNFLSQLGYHVIRAPYYFEGEADLKHLNNNVYIGAYGMRTSYQFLEWFEQNFDAKVIPFKINDPYCYHLDGCVLPLTENKVAVCVDIADRETVKEIEKFTEIIPVSHKDARSGVLNSVVLGKKLFNDSVIEYLSKSDSRYERELIKLRSVERIAKLVELEPVFVPMSEFEKSGACLSCLVMHLNWR